MAFEPLRNPKRRPSFGKLRGDDGLVQPGARKLSLEGGLGLGGFSPAHPQPQVDNHDIETIATATMQKGVVIMLITI